MNKPSQLLRSRAEEYFFCGPSPGMFLFIIILCLSRMTSEISHGSLLTARFRTRLFISNSFCCYISLIVLDHRLTIHRMPRKTRVGNRNLLYYQHKFFIEHVTTIVKDINEIGR